MLAAYRLDSRSRASWSRCCSRTCATIGSCSRFWFLPNPKEPTRRKLQGHLITFEQEGVEAACRTERGELDAAFVATQTIDGNERPWECRRHKPVGRPPPLTRMGLSRSAPRGAVVGAHSCVRFAVSLCFGG